MEDEIYEKLNKIESLEDKVLLKNVLNGVFVALEDYTDKKINSIEDRVFSEIKYKKEKYNIFSGLIKKDNIDLTNDFLYPILPLDLEEDVIETQDILKALEKGEPLKLFKVFMKCDYKVFNEFLNKDLKFKGVIETDKRIHEADFVVRKNNEYKSAIENLYESFINNNIAWSTINNPYIHKFADVYIVSSKDTIEADENIVKVDVDFGEYSKYVNYDMIPMWNIKKLVLKGSGFPVPCEDKVNYEHTISVAKEGKDNGYLVNLNKQDVNYVMFKDESIIVSSKDDTPQKWEILKIISFGEDKEKDYEFKLMSNEININFSNKLLFKNPLNIRTKSELSRVINSYKAANYLSFKEISLKDNDNFNEETYEVNDFIIDEIREEKIKRKMILYFQPKDKENYLNLDILSFLVSEVQLIYPEYKCEGRLI